ncbi:hypothetical protein COMX_02420 [Commensalibacter papalotli (ex Servin-Garciduenas et al. 2014)]|uniref:Uncharacterized protein n=1 Tax=Commensalibacter papalotli (ex Servin-Garciduenas et al. 2014) TaxID=1208583 RepID=W7E638_9PROT|nr:hypothetical protein COMX_02420 [Commensalibacter papalotli (ex Servin-Garciduenas et al. 2014)]
MRCASQITASQSTDNTVIVPVGCLDEIQIELQCKALFESIYYNFFYKIICSIMKQSLLLSQNHPIGLVVVLITLILLISF